MIRKEDKNEARLFKHSRMRNSLVGTSERPRLNVYRSSTHIYAQVIDDSKAITICSASTMDKKLQTRFKGKNKSECAFIVGEAVAKEALKKGVKAVVFDRGGYIYTGRVQKVAEGARSAGLQF